MKDYVGRFAPSPTGALHLGSLYTAIAGFLDAKSNNGSWLIRIEDIDETRAVPDAAQNIIKTLAIHGLHSDSKIIHQSHRKDRYQQVLERLFKKNALFYCKCSRKQLVEYSHYSGRCRELSLPSEGNAIRLLIEQSSLPGFFDGIQGNIAPQTTEDKNVFDFIVKRRDQFFSYLFSCVIDDIDQKVTHIIRGADILDSTPKQLLLFKHLEASAPKFFHLPLLINENGQKLSKQNLSPAISEATARDNILDVLTLLNQPTPPQNITINQTLDFAISHWNINKIPMRRNLTVDF